jgi:nitrite reductase/ring-hydroxylating ferredoxin subunit
MSGQHARVDGWVDLIDAADIKLGHHQFVEAEGLRLLVHHLDEGYFVTSSTCTHQEFEMDRCVLTGPVLTCTEHGWKFDVRTGAVVAVGDPADRLPSYRAEVRDGRVWAKLF